MRLKKSQKEAVLNWIASGKRTDEINALASRHKPPFEVSRQQVDFYRKTREVDLAAMLEAGQFDALTTGLATKEERVLKLKQLAAMMERDLFGGFLWTDQVKSIGQGNNSEIIEYEEFNRSEVDAFRGVLDDIAKEIGHRATRAELTDADGKALVIRVKLQDDDGP